MGWDQAQGTAALPWNWCFHVMGSSSPTIVPTLGQICRRCVGLLRSIDLIYSFRCYTIAVVLTDLFRHGAQYMALASHINEIAFSSHRGGLHHALVSNSVSFVFATGL